MYMWNGDDSQRAEVTVQDAKISIMYSDRDLQLNDDMMTTACMSTLCYRNTMPATLDNRLYPLVADISCLEQFTEMTKFR